MAKFGSSYHIFQLLVLRTLRRSLKNINIKKNYPQGEYILSTGGGGVLLPTHKKKLHNILLLLL